ncbi:MAG: hypothetical protein M1827_003786 [Pycnora praestabilis]|nr:MAG: hypothetical protein M1827_003786 [Pycnora praestabilis]
MGHHQQPSHYNGGHSHIGYAQAAPSRRSRNHDDLDLDISGLHTDDDNDDDDDDIDEPLDLLPHGLPQSHLASIHGYQPQPTHLHHHHLPAQGSSPKISRRGLSDMDSSMMSSGPPSVVGQAGMPSPAPPPRGPKLKFTPEDDQLLVDLKETKNLTWKQISEFFPGRSSGTLQVRYCTKLKAKTTQWTDETVVRLQNAMQEYENDRWRLVAAKVGNGFSPAACREKAREMQ